MYEYYFYGFIQQNQFFHLYTVKILTTPPSILLESDSCQALCPLECSEKGVEPADHSPQTENNVKKSYELNSKRINHCYICKPKVECTYVS